MSGHVKINEDNMRRLVEWTASVREQARRALEVEVPRLKAAFDRFAEAVRHADGE